MAGLSRRMLKAAMEHYLSAGSQTADEVLRPEEKLGEISHRQHLLGIGPTQLLDMPLGAKLPLLPGSNTLFYRTNLGEKLYQPPSGFDLGDPYCHLMTTKYRSLHDPHLRSYYKRKNNLRRLKKGGYVTNDNKVVCTLKEFNEYRQYLTTLKIEFEKSYMREQKMLEQQVTKLQDPFLLPEGADTSHFREWLLQEERENLQDRERQIRDRYVQMINKELEKIKCIAEEKRLLRQAEEEKKQREKKKKKQPILHIKMEEEWKQKEMLLLLKIGEDVKREARIEELRRKRREEKAKKKRIVLEKKMAYHLRKLQEHANQRVEFESHVKCLNTLLSEDPRIKNQGNGAMSPSRRSSLLNKEEISKSSLSSVTSQPTSDAVMSKTSSSLKKNVYSDIDEKLLDKEPSREYELGQSPLPRSSSSINDKLSVSASGEYSQQATSSTLGDLSISASVEHCAEAVSSSTSKLPISSSGTNLSRQPSVDGKICTITSLSSVVSQQGFDEIANNVTNEKRKSLRKQEELENTMELQEHDYPREEHGNHKEGLGQPALHESSSSINDQLYLSASGETPLQGTSSYTNKVYTGGPSESSRPENSNLSVSASVESGEEAGSSDAGAIPSSRPSLTGKSFPQTSPVSQSSDEMASHITNKAQFQDAITEELNNKIKTVLARVVSELTSILYPAVTEYEESIRDTVYTISEESTLSSDSSSSCSTCNEELFGAFASIPTSSTRKTIFTNISMKTTSSPGRTPSPLQSQKSSFMSLSNSMPTSLESEFWKENVHKGKTATPPHSRPESTSRLRRKVLRMGAVSEFPTKTFNTEKFPVGQTYFKRESSMKDAEPRKGLLGEDSFSDLNRDLPEGGILQKMFDKQRAADTNDNDNVRMLQVAENVVKEVFRRVKDLGDSISLLKKAPVELSERLFCSSFKRTEFPETFDKDFQKEIGLVAREIVATVFDNFHKCLVCSLTTASDEEPVIRRKDQAPARRTSRVSKSERNKLLHAESSAYDPTFSLFTVDKIAKEAVESVVFTLESFVAFQFKQDFKCKFSEIVKFPVENIPSAQQTPFLRPLSSQIAHEIEASSKTFEREMPGVTSKRMLDQSQSSSDVSSVSSMITKESIENAIGQVQSFHSELNIYATMAVNNVLDIFKRKLEKEISQRQTVPFYDDSEENTMAGEIIGAVLDQCAQRQTEVTLEQKFGTLEMEKSGRAFRNSKTLSQGIAASEGIKLPARKLKEIKRKEIDLRGNFPPINVPGMVIYSEEETEVEEDIPSHLCPTIHKCSEQDAYTTEVTKKSTYYISAPTRASRPSLGTITKQRAISSRMTLPPIGKQFSRKPFSPLVTIKCPRDEAKHRQVYEGHCEFMPAHETKCQPSQSLDDALPAKGVEEIISRVVTTVLNSVCSTSLEYTKSLSKTEVNEITETLKQSVEKIMSTNKISLVGAADEDQDLSPEHGDTVTHVVDNIYSNVLQESGSQTALDQDVTSSRTIFPEQTDSIVLHEISSAHLLDYFTENLSATELDSTAGKDLLPVSIQINIDSGSSGESMRVENENNNAVETVLQVEELPIEIVPYIGDKPLEVDPNLIADHLAVISIKTDAIEKLNEIRQSHSRMQLLDLRRSSISKHSLLSSGTDSDIERKRERRSSVNALGRLDVKPKEVVCRNSFQNLKKPDVSRVELLKDVKSKDDLILRLVTYDIEHDQEEDIEKVVNVDSAFVFESESDTGMEEEVTSFHKSNPIASTQDNLTTSQGPEKVNQYKITEETNLSVPKLKVTLASFPLDTDLLSALRKDSLHLSESVAETCPVPETQDKDQRVNMLQAHTKDTSRTTKCTFLSKDAGNKDSSLQEKTGVADLSDATVPRQGSSMSKKVPGVLSTIFSQGSSSSDISTPDPGNP
ncbi:fibrous sheath-interacting protein 2-like [Pelodiscus sinensis]|uniref:fibrous sheath-interacting protein 2-like n=1 Tax=Pelodiscus sinensis TaxID=13735 RepID=UPI003F6A6695